MILSSYRFVVQIGWEGELLKIMRRKRTVKIIINIDFNLLFSSLIFRRNSLLLHLLFQANDSFHKERTRTVEAFISLERWRMKIVLSFPSPHH